MTDPILRARVERLLGGDFRPEDITRLFLGLRARSFGRETVVELGDFVAHSDERYKGVTTRAARDWFLSWQFAMPYIQGFHHDLQNLPLFFPEAMQGIFRQLSDEEIRNDTGLKRKFAYRALESGLAALTKSSKGGLAIPKTLNHDEQAILACVMRYIVVKPAFDDTKLFEELTGALVKNGLLKESEKGQFSLLKHAIALFAMAIMHLCKIRIDATNEALLQASPDTGKGVMGVWSSASVAQLDGGTIRIAGAIFSTSIKHGDCCETALLAESSTIPWTCPIELTPNKTLAKL